MTTIQRKIKMTDENTTQHKIDEAAEGPVIPGDDLPMAAGIAKISDDKAFPIRENLFVKKEFRMHSGGIAHYKIECDALTDGDIETLAYIISEKAKQMTMGQLEGHGIGRVIGVPRGGLRLANALQKYVTAGRGITLIVDDVLTTGKSMEEAKLNSSAGDDVIGVVIFARSECPSWIFPVFSMKWFNTKDD